jgi:hypothetical protein
LPEITVTTISPNAASVLKKPQSVLFASQGGSRAPRRKIVGAIMTVFLVALLASHASAQVLAQRRIQTVDSNDTRYPLVNQPNTWPQSQTFQSPMTADAVSATAVNSVLNAARFSGTDIGAQVNAALSTLPNGWTSYGRVVIPPANYTQSTTISLANYPHITLDCQGANLYYTGSTFAVDALQPTAGNATGGVVNCNFFAPATAVAGVSVIRFGNMNGYTIGGNSFWNFNAANDTAILATNTLYFTEDSKIYNNVVRQTTVGYQFLKNCSGGDCTNSFEYTYFRNNYYSSPYNSVTGAVGLVVSGGAALQNAVVELHGNLNGPSGGKLISIATATDLFLRNQVNIHAEQDGSPSTAVCVENNGTFVSASGALICDGGLSNTGKTILTFGTEGGLIGNESVQIPSTQVIYKSVSPSNLGPFTANLGLTTLDRVPSGSGSLWYEVSCLPIITVAATTSSALPTCSVTWSDGFTGATSALQVTGSQSGNVAGATGLGTYTGTARVFVAQGSTLKISTTGYASTGATAMAYKVAAAVVKIGQ